MARVAIVFTAMDANDMKRVVQALDAALRVFRQYEGRLTASQVRARSMLSVVRSELALELPAPGDANLFAPPPSVDGSLPRTLPGASGPWPKRDAGDLHRPQAE